MGDRIFVTYPDWTGMESTREVLQGAVGHVYDLERELGGGGMSRVWLARDKSLGRDVVIKVLDPQVAAAVSMARFRREIELCARLQHPQIVPLLSAGDAGGVPYYTMPFVEGESLRQAMNRGATLSPSQVIHVLGDVALALDYAHRHGVVHRDIKPENILLVGRSAMVTDFGIAKALSEATDESGIGLTTTGVSPGTPAYMAPEQHSADRIDQRADLYAWGVVAYELIHGAHPFAQCKHPQEFLRAHLTEIPRPLVESSPDIAPSLDAVVMRCLAKAPEARPGSALDIVKVLESLRGMNGEAPMRSGRRVPRAVRAALAVLIVAAAGAAVWRAWRGSETAAVTSIAVIPFANVSRDTAQDYFADGMADELSTELGRVPGVRVASRTAAYRFKGRRDLDVRDVRQELGVDAVVQGTIRRVSNRWRVSAQLTSAATGEEIWSDRFDREARDVLAVQDEISAAVANALRARLLASDTDAAILQEGDSGSSPAVPPHGTRDPVAYDLYLRGRYLLERRGPTVRRAVELFDQAIGADSLFARAHASRALALLLVPFYAEATIPAVLQQAETSARRALELDARLADGHLALAGVYRVEWRWAEALDQFRIALDLDPQNVPARLNYSQMLYAVGDPDRSLEQARQAKALDPRSALALLGEARVLTLAGRHREVVSLIERAIEFDPLLPQTRVYLAMALLRAGDSTRALATIDSAATIPSGVAEAAYVIAAAAGRARVEALMRQVHAQARPTPFQFTTIALTYLAISDTLRALDAFEVAARNRELIPLNLGFVDPIYDPIRASSRFAAVVSSYGLDPRRFVNVVRPRRVTG